ncbi:hypothetical protein D3C87_1101540 [compost metagenome]
MEAVHHLAVETTQVRRQEVADAVAGANVVAATSIGELRNVLEGVGEFLAVGIAGEAAECAIGCVDQVGADAIGAERVEHGVVPERRGVVAAEADFTEPARQAHGRTARECRDARLAVVVADRGFEPEAGGQATTEVFRATEAQAAGVVARVGQFAAARLDAAAVQVERVVDGEAEPVVRDAVAQVTRGGRVAADRRVDHTKQRDGRLSRGNTGNSQGSQSSCPFTVDG